MLQFETRIYYINGLEEAKKYLADTGVRYNKTQKSTGVSYVTLFRRKGHIVAAYNDSIQSIDIFRLRGN